MIENNSPLLPITVNTGCPDPEPITVSMDPDAVLVDPDIMALDAVMFCNMLTLPVTVKLADINTDWFSGLTEDAVLANDADMAFNTYDAVVAKEADTAFNTYEAVAAVVANELLTALST